jgi:glycosyltransferase involved in cell wall biosynthesis/SAM-dependent methyltransferase
MVVDGRVSVIVPTKNSERTIEACLRSIRDQSYSDVELIVVDNSSSDRTRELAIKYADGVLDRGPERSAQRNAGARQSTGEFLLFVDSDMVPSPEVASDVASTFRSDPDAAGLVVPERSFGQGFWARCRALEKELYLRDPDVEAARAFRRDTFESVGGYDEMIHGGGEDWELPERIAQEGGSIARVSAEIFHDDGRLSLRDDLKKKFYYGRSFARYARKQPRQTLRKLARTVFLRRMASLFRRPAYGAGLVVMKMLEAGALVGGIMTGVVTTHPAERSYWRPLRGLVPPPHWRSVQGRVRRLPQTELATKDVSGRKARQSADARPLSERSRLGDRRRLANRYATEHPQLGQGSVPRLLRTAIGIIMRQGKGVILDLGCGEGQTLKAIENMRCLTFTIGIDMSSERVRVMRAQGLRGVVADGLKLPFADESVSVVVCRHVIEHVPDDVALIREIGRILRPQGFLYVETPLKLRGGWYPYGNQSREWVLDPTHVREYTSVPELRERLVAGGVWPLTWRTSTLSFPLSHVLYRIAWGSRRPPSLMQGLLDGTGLRVPIPRYREIQMLAQPLPLAGLSET